MGTAKKTPKAVEAVLHPISAYKFEAYDPTPADRSMPMHGGWDKKTGTLVPMTIESDLDWCVSDIFDQISFAAESGVLTHEGWLKQLFRSTEDFETFLVILEDFETCYRIADKWYAGLIRLAGNDCEYEGAVTGEELAEQIRDYAIETGQLTR